MRDKSISMTKGLAIIFMVMVHARFSHNGDVFVNMFHMPLFFFMSGYCFKGAYLSDFRNYLKKRVKGAYWPYVKWSLLFLLLHNVFYALNIYNGEYGYRGTVSELYTISDFLKHAAMIVFTMSGGEQLLGGFWFLHTYFIAAIISFITIWLVKKNIIYLMSGGGILLLLCVLLLYLRLQVPHLIGGKELLASAIMVWGVAYKKSRLRIEDYPLVTIPVCFLIVLIGSFIWPCSMLSVTWIKVIPYSFSAILGTLMLFSFCKWLYKRNVITQSLTYIGDKTIDILTWHLLSFKIVSLLIIAVYKLPMAQLAEYPVIEEYAYQGFWVLYLIVGVSLSLIIAKLFNYIELGFVKAFNKNNSQK